MNLRLKTVLIIAFVLCNVNCSEDEEETSSGEGEEISSEEVDGVKEILGKDIQPNQNVTLATNETVGKKASKQFQSQNGITYLDGSHVSNGRVPSSYASTAGRVPSHVSTAGRVPSYVSTAGRVPSHVSTAGRVPSYASTAGRVPSHVSTGSVPSYVSYWPSATKQGEPLHNLVLQRGHVLNYVQPPQYHVGIQPCVPKHIKVPYTVYVTKVQPDGTTITSYLPRATDYITTTKYQTRYITVPSTASRTVRVTVTGTRFITKTTSLIRTTTLPTYITTTLSVPQYITTTQTLSKYITRTKSVPVYTTRTQTVPRYITTTEQQLVTLTQIVGGAALTYPPQTIPRPQYVAVTETVPQFIGVTQTAPQYVGVTQSPYVTSPQVFGGGIGDPNIYNIGNEAQLPGPHHLQVQHSYRPDQVPNHDFRFGPDTQYQTFNPNGDQFAIINSGLGHVQGNHTSHGQEVGFIG